MLIVVNEILTLGIFSSLQTNLAPGVRAQISAASWRRRFLPSAWLPSWLQRRDLGICNCRDAPAAPVLGTSIARYVLACGIQEFDGFFQGLR